MNNSKLNDLEGEIKSRSETSRLLDSNSYQQTTFQVTPTDPTRELHTETENDTKHNASISISPLSPNPRIIPNFIWIEVSLLLNVFLAGFDGTVTASAYTTIGEEFHAVNLASWITTSYLITSTTFQPLYGSFSDILGRRVCLLMASGLFCLGCLWCYFTNGIISLIFARSFMGIGGGGLITLSTIINSDIIPTRKRGLFQAFQNLVLGFGAICGASFGGVLSEAFSWRFCFLIQVPFSLLSIAAGYSFVQNQAGIKKLPHFRSLLEKIDILGGFLLVCGLSALLLVLTFAGTRSTDNYGLSQLLLLFLLGVLFLSAFVYIEFTTKAAPIIPLKSLQGLYSTLVLTIGFFTGLAGYAYLFTLPLLFQLVLGDSPSKAGLRLALPSLSTPIGGLICGILMHQRVRIGPLLFSGVFLMSLGYVLSLFVYPGISPILLGLFLIPANVGQGIGFPSSLFSFIFAFPQDSHATSTSTLYLIRSIGSLFGVGGLSAVIQLTLRKKLSADLSETTNFNENQIREIIHKVTESMSSLYDLPDAIQRIVLSDYTFAIRKAQKFTMICCFIALFLCILKDLIRPKTHSGFRY
ncbi:vacuolar amino acid uptake transporter [Schizosaccharomyces osmophilus]|uniref:Vacuolar amino acid uptake transporter n=1 Tax=Schizosaccharomyces osmophilus TaxID=2545709 RepID=A0AAF0ATC7_9SCHI|nr:vacuolar amino acid uptake transporter [Schizosaccharomyces osmophilus]WBW70637.1 vacuolar amino acid uptake transporter [Schizosaccharomyces osmophilus]